LRVAFSLHSSGERIHTGTIPETDLTQRIRVMAGAVPETGINTN
jgi:hypothetical protein